MLNLYPDPALFQGRRPDLELVLLVDVSGSQQGWPLERDFSDPVKYASGSPTPTPVQVGVGLKPISCLGTERGVLFGFGHAVLRVEDPRATVQYALGEQIASQDPLFRLAVNLRKVGIAAQIVYERKEARGGKGTPIVRPKYIYSGPVRS